MRTALVSRFLLASAWRSRLAVTSVLISLSACSRPVGLSVACWLMVSDCRGKSATPDTELGAQAQCAQLSGHSGHVARDRPDGAGRRGAGDHDAPAGGCLLSGSGAWWRLK